MKRSFVKLGDCETRTQGRNFKGTRIYKAAGPGVNHSPERPITLHLKTVVGDVEKRTRFNSKVRKDAYHVKYKLGIIPVILVLLMLHTLV